MKIELLVVLSAMLLFGCLGSAPIPNAPKTASDTNASIATNDSPKPANPPLPSSDNLTSVPSANSTPSTVDPNQARFDRIIEEVIPAEGIELNASWNDIGPKTANSGALNMTRFESLMARNGRPLTDEERSILLNGSDSRIRIDRNNSYFVLNLFWAFGLVNKNPIIDNGTISEEKSNVGNYASTGGWPLGNESGGALLSSQKLITLDKKQQALVDSIAGNTYRPCCNNPTSFPDCNHGMAALGLAEWMAYQNASEDSIYRALLAANSYWFPQAYVDAAVFLEENNRSWNGTGPKELLSANYSSYSGYQNVMRSLNESVPGVNGGGRC